MKIIFTLLSIFCLKAAYTQDATVIDLKKKTHEVAIKKDPKDTIPAVWKKGGLFNININQGSLNNWSAGGDKFSLSINSYLNVYAYYKNGKHAWDNNLDLTYGMTQTTSLGSRKSSDRIDFTTKYGYAIGKQINFSGLMNVRSQFADGFAYAKDDAGIEKVTRTSRSFSPTYVLLSLGIDYKPSENFSLLSSPMTGRWVLVSDKTIGPLYGLDPDKKIKSEMGAFISANFQKTFHSGISFKSKLDLFSNYKSRPENIDIFFTNVLSAKITKYINFSLNVDMIYDDNTQNVVPGKGPAPQWLQLMGIGFAYKFVKS